MMEKRAALGHLMAVLTIIFWGTTFVSTKLLLVDLTPIGILISRFIIGYFVLLLMKPKFMRSASFKDELLFVGAGFFGISAYYLLENTALTYSYASNVGVITSSAPLFTAIASLIFLKEEKPRLTFYIGFVIAMAGIAVISFNSQELGFNPLGDLLALLSSITWAFYSVFIKKIGDRGYDTIQSTRRIFFYGIIFMLLSLTFLDAELSFTLIRKPVNLFNILYLGLGASAICFVSWNYAVALLGTVKTSVYIYLVPVITVIASFFVLDERISLVAFFGIALIIFGLIFSELKLKKRVEA